MNVLSIGNSFSDNAHRYLHKIGRLDNRHNVYTYNLYIGGCPLSTHYRNMHSDERAYAVTINGMGTLTKLSIKEALLAMDWDVVTLQQASHFSTNYATYQPYISEIAELVRYYCPKAKIVIHQTWAYEQGSEKLAKLNYENSIDMYRDLATCYENAAKDTNANAIIPAGYAMQALAKLGYAVHADTFHANSLGKLVIAATWYQALTGRSIKELDFSYFDFDAPIGAEEIELAKRVSYEAVKKFGFEVKAI
jgi:hypothetical protein